MDAIPHMATCIFHPPREMPAHHLRAVLDGLLRVEGALLPCEALHNDLGVPVDPDLGGGGHHPSAGHATEGPRCYSSGESHDVVGSRNPFATRYFCGALLGRASTVSKGPRDAFPMDIYTSSGAAGATNTRSEIVTTVSRCRSFMDKLFVRSFVFEIYVRLVCGGIHSQCSLFAMPTRQRKDTRTYSLRVGVVVMMSASRRELPYVCVYLLLYKVTGQIKMKSLCLFVYSYQTKWTQALPCHFCRQACVQGPTYMPHLVYVCIFSILRSTITRAKCTEPKEYVRSEVC